MITYKKMSLFDAPEGSVLVHSCNALGVWGSGIAAEFNTKYPRSFIEYKRACRFGLIENERYGIVGSSYLCSQENKRNVCCLITSFAYGKDRDSANNIIAQTNMALAQFCRDLKNANLVDKAIYSNKFNSGMFKVPWNYSEMVLKYFVDRYDLNWVVCDPDLR